MHQKKQQSNAPKRTITRIIWSVVLPLEPPPPPPPLLDPSAVEDVSVPVEEDCSVPVDSVEEDCSIPVALFEDDPSVAVEDSSSVEDSAAPVLEGSGPAVEDEDDISSVEDEDDCSTGGGNPVDDDSCAVVGVICDRRIPYNRINVRQTSFIVGAVFPQSFFEFNAGNRNKREKGSENASKCFVCSASLLFVLGSVSSIDFI